MNLSETAAEQQRLLLALKPRTTPIYKHPFTYLIVYGIAKFACFHILAGDLMGEWAKDKSSNDLMMLSMFMAILVTGLYVWLAHKLS